MSLRGQRVGRRTRDASWQWMIIGIFLGMGCSLVMLLTANVFGFVEFSAVEEDATAVVLVATSTPNDLAQQPTNPVDVGQPATFTPSADGGGVATPTPTFLPGGPTNQTPNPADGSDGPPAVGTQPITPQEPVGLPTSSVPQSLAAAASPLLPVEGGAFMMGTSIEEGQQAVAECTQRDGANCIEAMILDSTPPHQVTLDPFQIEQFEVSVAQYVAFLNFLLETGDSQNPHLSACNGQLCALTTRDSGYENSDIEFDGTQYRPRAAGTELDRSNYPVTLVTWYGAKSYCQALGRDLPTEAQWERAARGPSNWLYPWGQQWVPENANTNRSGPVDPSTYVEVDSFRDGQSPYGAYNMAGNVAEWTNDWYSASYYPQSESLNPRGPTGGEVKVVRGGSWDNPPIFARAVHRMDQFGQLEAEFSVGFRCAAAAGVSSNAPVNSSQPQAAANANEPTPLPTLAAGQ